MNRCSRLSVAVVMAAAGASMAACAAPSAAPNDPPGHRAAPSVSAAAPVTGGPSSSTAGSPSAAGPSLPGGWRQCVNAVEGFSIGYPGGWHTTQLRPREVCHQFHPTAFEIPRESEYPLTALNAGPVEGPPDRVDSIHLRVLLWQETTVNGRRAVRVENESTGEGLHPRGTRWYGYTIRFPNGWIRVFAAAGPGAAGYPEWKAVVDQAARTLRGPTR